jgi:hypothetical protein
MKKYLYILLPVLFCFLTACSPYSNLKQTQIIDSGKYYRIYKENYNQVRYEIYNPEGKIALSEKTDRPIEINMISDDTIDIGIDMGTGITIHKYYNANENIFSGEFTNVLTNSDKFIAYFDVFKENPFENRKVVVQNIFDKNMFYKEFKLDFSNVDTPVIEAKFSKDGASLLLTYLSGEKQTQTSEILDLTV